MEAFQVTLILAFALAACELLTGSFVLLGLGVGALVVAVTQWASGGMSINRDLLTFAGSSLVAFVACRRLFQKDDDQQNSSGDVNRY